MEDIRAEVITYSHIAFSGSTLVAAEQQTITGMKHTGDKETSLQENTWVIPNQLGTGFRLEVLFSNSPEDIKHFDVLITFLEMTLPSGQKRSSLNRKIKPGGYSSLYYWDFSFYFDHIYETTPGKWSFTVKAGDTLLYNTTFTIVEAGQQ